jgi:hypothetical protein
VPANDQRAAPFTRVFDGDGVGGARIDIGAFELQTATPVQFGDYNGNGVVDGADYVMWRNTLGTNVSPFTGADGNGDGVVGQGDYNVWRAHFGETVLSGAASTAFSASVEPPPPQTSQVPEARATVSAATGSGGLPFNDFGRSVGSARNAGIPAGPSLPSNLRKSIPNKGSPRSSTEALTAWLASRGNDKRLNDHHALVLPHADLLADTNADARLDELDAAFASLSPAPGANL